MRESADAVLEKMLGLMPVCSMSATMATQRHRRHVHMQWCVIYATLQTQRPIEMSVKASAERRVMRESADAVLEKMLGHLPVC